MCVYNSVYRGTQDINAQQEERAAAAMLADPEWGGGRSRIKGVNKRTEVEGGVRGLCGEERTKGKGEGDEQQRG